MKNEKCKLCGTELKKDWIALHRKLLDIDAKEFLCISCLADTFGCDVEDLSHVIKAINVPDSYAKGTIRISLGKDNTIEEAKIIGETLVSVLMEQK